MKTEDIKNLNIGDTIEMQTIAGLKSGEVIEIQHTYSKECAWVRISGEMPAGKTLVNNFNGELISKT